MSDKNIQILMNWAWAILIFFIGIVVMVIQPDLAERDGSFSVGRTEKGADLRDRLVQPAGQALRVGRVDPGGVLHPDKPLRLLFGEPRGLWRSPYVDDPRDITRKETPDQLIRGLFVFRESRVPVMGVRIKVFHRSMDPFAVFRRGIEEDHADVLLAGS